MWLIVWICLFVREFDVGGNLIGGGKEDKVVWILCWGLVESIGFVLEIWRM